MLDLLTAIKSLDTKYGFEEEIERLKDSYLALDEHGKSKMNDKVRELYEFISEMSELDTEE